MRPLHSRPVKFAPSSPRLRRPVAWLALLALLAGSLLPALAHALASEAQRTVWAEVCTAQGMKLVPVAAEPGDDSSTADPADGARGDAPMSLHGATDHCPWCLLMAAPALAPPPASVLWLPPLPAFGLPERFFSAARTAAIWQAAQPRGPPSLLS